MSSKLLTGSVVFAACLMLIFAGCAPETETGEKSVSPSKIANVRLNFTAGNTAKYKVVTKAVKDFRFEQPSLNKLKEERTGSKVETIFTQTIDSVDGEGNAVASITLDSIKYHAQNKSGVVLDFDSATNTDHALATLIGRSYRIRMSPSGSVSSVDISSARAVSPDKFVKSFLADKSIKTRHEVLALPDASGSKLIVGQSWSEVKTPPPGMLDPKNFEKTYTLKSVRGNMVEIKMEAIPTSKKVEDVDSESSPVDAFVELFDADDSWSGGLTLDLSSGQVSKYNETLVSTYIAAEQSRVQVEGKGPDMLTMGLTSSVSLEKID
ncbi:MAG: hypothetical protein KAJ07_04315 [Planctomycetes bacterium]|nr:hypothetical protein [Planctomycetota bacterium]